MRFVIFLALGFALHASAGLVNRQFPRLIIPLDKRQPDRAFGTQKEGNIQHAVNTEISFDVPSNNAATYCKLSFYINTDPKKNAPRALWGEAPYRFNISSLASNSIDPWNDSWNSHPKSQEHVGWVEVNHAGNVKTSDLSVPCAKGNTAQYIMYPDNPKRDFGFTWFELDYEPPHGIVYEMFT